MAAASIQVEDRDLAPIQVEDKQTWRLHPIQVEDKDLSPIQIEDKHRLAPIQVEDKRLHQGPGPHFAEFKRTLHDCMNHNLSSIFSEGQLMISKPFSNPCPIKSKGALKTSFRQVRPSTMGRASVSSKIGLPVASFLPTPTRRPHQRTGEGNRELAQQPKAEPNRGKACQSAPHQIFAPTYHGGNPHVFHPALALLPDGKSRSQKKQFREDKNGLERAAKTRGCDLLEIRIDQKEPYYG